jgi:hypothetical protein
MDHQRPSGGVAFPEPRLTGRIFYTAQTIGKPSKNGRSERKNVDRPVRKNYTTVDCIKSPSKKPRRPNTDKLGGADIMV